SRRSCRPSNAIAFVGQASAQARQSSGHLAASITGSPRKRSGNDGSWRGNAIVRYPCFNRAKETCSIGLPPALGIRFAYPAAWVLQIMSTIRKIKALVAQREVGNLLVSQGQR